MRGYLTHTQACNFEASPAAQVTGRMYEGNRSSHIRTLNSTVKYVFENKVSIEIPKLEESDRYAVGFSGASFANNYDQTTQLGYILFVRDGKHSSVPILFKSYKARRVVRSVLAGERIAFSDMFDEAHALVTELRRLLPHLNIPLTLLTDSKSLFDVI